MPNKTTRTKSFTYETLRARLIERGQTLRGFALKHGYSAQTVYDAAKHRRNGVKSKQIQRQLEALAA